MEFSSPQGAFSADTTLWLFTSLSSGSSTIVTATARMEGILKANRIPFKALDVATEEKARMLWGRRAGKRKLPGLVRQGMVLADLAEVEEWNEYGEVRENLLDEEELKPAAAAAAPAASVAAAAPARPANPTPASATTHNAAAVGAGPPAVSPAAAAIKAAGTPSLKSVDSPRASAESGRSAESERKEHMLTLAEQVAAKAKKSSALRTTTGAVVTRTSVDSTASKAASASAPESDVKQEAPAASSQEPEAEAKLAATEPVVRSHVGDAPQETIEKIEEATAIKEEPKKEASTAAKSTERVVPVMDDSAESKAEASGQQTAKGVSGETAPSEAKAKAEAGATEQKTEAKAQRVTASDEHEKAPKPEGEAGKGADEEEESSEEEDDAVLAAAAKRKTHNQGQVEAEILMMLNSPTTLFAPSLPASPTADSPLTTSSPNTKRGIQLPNRFDIDSAEDVREAEYKPGFANSPLTPGAGATWKDFEFGLTGTGDEAATENKEAGDVASKGIETTGDITSRSKSELARDQGLGRAPAHMQQQQKLAGGERGLKNQTSLAHSEGSGGMTEKGLKMPAEEDEEETPGCFSMLFCGGGGKKKKKQKTS